MKRILISLLLMLCLLAVPAQGQEVQEENTAMEDAVKADRKDLLLDNDETKDLINDGQNPIMNFIGNYMCDRARFEVLPAGDNSAQITVRWGSSAFDSALWTMSGVFDTDTLEISYSDCTKKVISYDRDSEESEQSPEETVDYTDGSGTVIFGEDGTLTWDDNQEHIADGMVFEYLVNVDPLQTVPMPGGWEIIPHEAGKLPEDAQDAFDKATQELSDAEYIPVALMATQLVAGMNYCILCQITSYFPDAKTSWALVYIYADLEGHAEITNVYELYIPLHSTPDGKQG